MRAQLRLLKLEASPGQVLRSFYVCSACRHEVRSAPLLAQPVRRNASNSSITEGLRRKIWGTDNPPGLKDPYGGPGALGKLLGKSSQQPPEDGYVTSEDNYALEDDQLDFAGASYEPASHIKDIQTKAGHLGKWFDYPPTEADLFAP